MSNPHKTLVVEVSITCLACNHNWEDTIVGGNLELTDCPYADWPGHPQKYSFRIDEKATAVVVNKEPSSEKEST